MQPTERDILLLAPDTESVQDLSVRKVHNYVYAHILFFLSFGHPTSLCSSDRTHCVRPLLMAVNARVTFLAGIIAGHRTCVLYRERGSDADTLQSTEMFVSVVTQRHLYHCHPIQPAEESAEDSNPGFYFSAFSLCESRKIFSTFLRCYLLAIVLHLCNWSVY